MHGDTREVRDGDALDWPALASFLRWHFTDGQLPGLRLDAGMDVSQFPGGHSNLTYLVRLGGAELVLRRPPLGIVAPHTHDVAREFRWLTALHPLFPLAPRPYVLCDDPSVLGSPFYIMERRRGIVVRGGEPLPLAGHEDRRRRVSESLIDTLADLHALDVSSGPMAMLGHPVGFVDRQVRGCTAHWEQARVEPFPEMDAVALWLVAHQPPDTLDPTVVHGGFTLDNVLLDPLELSHVVAVFDWETAALGDPLVDLGILLASWTPRGPGYLTRDALVERYAGRTGRSIADIVFHEVLALFLRAVSLQQAWLRERSRGADEAAVATLCDRMTALASRAYALAHQT